VASTVEEAGGTGKGPVTRSMVPVVVRKEEAAPPEQHATVPKIRITPAPIPESLAVVMGLGERTAYSVRSKAVHSLDDDLSGQEIQALYALLNRKKGEDRLKPGHLNALKNDVLNVLGSQSVPPPDFAGNLMAMYHDLTHDNVWRDYCIQHLGGWYGRADVNDREAIAATLWKATRETKISIAGTALIALASNCSQPGIEKARVTEKALDLSTNPACGHLAKITALQICAQLGEDRVLPTARVIAASKSSVTLRMSAIAAVGTLGDQSDRPMLEEYASSTDVRLRKSARSALTRLKD